MELFLSYLFGYSSNVGLINQTFQLIFSIKAFISSAAPFHTIIFSDFIQKIFDANNEFTFNQLGYSLINVSILAFISSIIFCGGK
jgi:hypothetical protein